MKKYKMVIIVSTVAIVLGTGIWLFSYGCRSDWCLVTESQKIQATENYEQCVARGFDVSGQSPKICLAGDKIFIESPK